MEGNKYTIHTENKNLDQIKKLLKSHLATESFTIIGGLGSYYGEEELTVKIEIITLSTLDNWMKSVCRQITEFNKQDSVWLTKEKIDFEIINS